MATGRLHDVCGRKVFPLKKDRSEALGQEPEPDGSRHGKKHYESQSPVQKAVVAVKLPAVKGRRQTRQQYRSQGDPEKRRRKFHQTVGVIKPRHGAVIEARSNVGVDENGNRSDRHPDHGRNHKMQGLTHRTVFK